MITEDLSVDDLAARLGGVLVEDHPPVDTEIVGERVTLKGTVPMPEHDQTIGVIVDPQARPTSFINRFAIEVEAEVRRQKGYRYIQPPTEQIQSFIDFVQDDRQHYMLGFPELDLRTRGYRPGELIMVAGYSQGGKSQLLLTSILHNTDKPILWVTMDEPAEMVMSKLVAMVTRTGADKLEEAIKQGDRKTIDHVRATVKERFDKLQISIGTMADAVKEAEDYFQQALSAQMIDYLGIIPCDAEGDAEKAKLVKAYASEQRFPLFVIHQNSRSGGGPGEEITLTSLAFGGDREATMIIGVRRKKLKKGIDDWEKKAHENTVSVSIVKNKRPPAKLGEWDFNMDPETGVVLPRSVVVESQQATGGSWKDKLQNGGIDKHYGEQQSWADDVEAF